MQIRWTWDSKVTIFISQVEWTLVNYPWVWAWVIMCLFVFACWLTVNLRREFRHFLLDISWYKLHYLISLNGYLHAKSMNEWLIIQTISHYVVEGSGEPELCPAGTFSAVPGLTSEAGCQPCTAGFYCREAGLEAPTGPCSQGKSIHCDMGHRYYKT